MTPINNRDFVPESSNFLVFDYNSIAFVSGSNKTSPHIHSHSAHLSNLPLGDKILLFNLNSLPSHAGCHDRHPEGVRPVLYTSRNEDTGRCHAGNDKTK